MSWTRIAHVEQASTDSNGFTSSAIDTTGADVIVVLVVSYFGGSVPANVSDNKGNAYTALTAHDTGTSTVRTRFLVCETPTVGSGHTFTLSNAGNFPSLAVSAWSGSLGSGSTDQQNGAFSNSATSIQPGSVTPASGSLVLAGKSIAQAGELAGLTIDSSFSAIDGVNLAAGVNYGCALATKVSSSAENPTWAWSGATEVSTAIVTIKPAAASGTAWTLLDHASAVSTDGHTVDSPAIDASLADFLIVAVTHDNNLGAATFASDSPGNTIATVFNSQVKNFGSAGTTLYWTKTAFLASASYVAHITTPAGGDPSVAVAAFSGSLQGADPNDALNDGTGAGGVTSLVSGSLSPSQARELLVALIGLNAANTLAIDSSFTIIEQRNFTANAMGIGLAYQQQAAAVTRNPTWSWSAAATAMAQDASFKAAPTTRRFLLH